MACILTPPRQCLLMWFQYPLTLSKPGSSPNFVASRSTASSTGRIMLAAWWILPSSLYLFRKMKYSRVLDVSWTSISTAYIRFGAFPLPAPAPHPDAAPEITTKSDEKEGPRWSFVPSSLLHLVSLILPHFDLTWHFRAQLLHLRPTLASSDLQWSLAPLAGNPLTNHPVREYVLYIWFTCDLCTRRVLQQSNIQSVNELYFVHAGIM